MRTWIIVIVVAVLLIGITGRVGKNRELRIREIAALEKIALNLGEVSMSLDNIVDLKAEIMADLDERLPFWAWKEIQ